MRGAWPRADELRMLIASPRTKVRVRSSRRSALMPPIAFALFAAAAVALLAAYGSTVTALVAAVLVNAAANPLAHAAGLRRRPPVRAE